VPAYPVRFGYTLREEIMGNQSGNRKDAFGNPGDWIVVISLILFLISVFALSWISIGLNFNVFGRSLIRRNLKTLGILDIPWYWLVILLVVAAAALAGLFFPTLKGALSIVAGVYFIIFSIIFYFGAWYKINAVIGDVVSLVRELPFVGSYLGALVGEITKKVLVVRFLSGYFLFIVASVAMLAGGIVRLFSSGGAGAEQAESEPS